VKRALLFFVLLTACRDDPALIDAGNKLDYALAHYSRLPRDRVAVTSRPLDLETPSIVFVYAAWSVQSVLALRQLTSILAAEWFAPPLVIVDTDDEAAVSMLEPVPSGNGETFWVRDHRVVASVLRFDELRERAVAVVEKNNALLR
jgi:hypothetical protein